MGTVCMYVCWIGVLFVQACCSVFSGFGCGDFAFWGGWEMGLSALYIEEGVWQYGNIVLLEE